MFWKNKKIFITGHTGFKGGWLTMFLLSKGASVAGYSFDPLTRPSLFEVLKLRDKVNSITGDIRDLDKITKAIRDFSPDVVFHLAAQPLVKISYDNPVETFETNVIGTVNVLEAVRKTDGVKAGVFITSDKCYENNGQVKAYKENDRLGGYDPYSASKACAELVISSYRNSYFGSKTPIASTRAGNVIGGGDWSKDRIVPDIVRALYEKAEIFIRNPDAVRPWQHVMEPVSGYVILAEKLFGNGGKYSEAWNFGPNNTEAVPVRDIVKQAVGVSGKKLELKSDMGENAHEAGYLMLDSSKAKELLGWSAKLETKEAVRITMEWYDAFYRGEKMDHFTMKQINDYEDRL